MICEEVIIEYMDKSIWGYECFGMFFFWGFLKIDLSYGKDLNVKDLMDILKCV